MEDLALTAGDSRGSRKIDTVFLVDIMRGVKCLEVRLHDKPNRAYLHCISFVKVRRYIILVNRVRLSAIYQVGCVASRIVNTCQILVLV